MDQMKKDGLKAGFKEVDRVIAHLPSTDKLFRSSSPNYDGHKDSSQHFTPQSIPFLTKYKIRHVISLNHEAKDIKISKPLADAKIEYTPLPVEDFKSPTLAQLEEAWKRYKAYRSGTLVWCGYGHGRTGTMVSALQIYAIKERGATAGLSTAEYNANHVEEPAQRATLDELQKKLGLKKPA
ncbi:hypothetical protein CCM_09335 [Cordyceps militaris CM01]|uniref:Swiss Army Knife protein DSP-PTPase phosphatase domain-containing protein n=1 Tax=Cordyceps militaris (strain CM01) TaxID=983644 RepID=G3JU45_CORMM|nr:uncharacterized protein CCM_09335 [Cordyceps militaris CM01]EGX88199.1 hypothetical protein CCM_09335 [Cordyceps militaris CM01]